MGDAPSQAKGRLLKLLQPGLDAWNTGDLEAALSGIDPEIAWHTAGVFPDIEPVYRGHDGLRRFWATFVEPWECIVLDVAEVLGESGTTEDGRMLTHSRFRARGREGIELDLEVFQLFRVRNGLLVEFRVFAGRDEALAATGFD